MQVVVITGASAGVGRAFGERGASIAHETVPGDAGAHGVSDDVAAPHSPHLWSNTHRGAIGAALAVAAFVGLVSLVRGRRGQGAARSGSERKASPAPRAPRPAPSR